jgi:hypothetical protein
MENEARVEETLAAGNASESPATYPRISTVTGGEISAASRAASMLLITIPAAAGVTNGHFRKIETDFVIPNSKAPIHPHKPQ